MRASAKRAKKARQKLDKSLNKSLGKSPGRRLPFGRSLAIVAS
jgi:hypothetical protein